MNHASSVPGGLRTEAAGRNGSQMRCCYSRRRERTRNGALECSPQHRVARGASRTTTSSAWLLAIARVELYSSSSREDKLGTVLQNVPGVAAVRLWPARYHTPK